MIVFTIYSFHLLKIEHILPKFFNRTSSALSINSSVVQGLVLVPLFFIINAFLLKPVRPLNEMIKFADDTYLVVPSSNNNSNAIRIF